MKLKLSLLAGVLLIGTTLNAQQKDIKLENIVNEQFGTLLESLLKEGKIDQTNAQSYLETVFGYDDTVNNYLQTNNFSQQFMAMKQNYSTKLTTEGLLSQLNSSLISFIPTNKQQAFTQQMEVNMLTIGTMNELSSGTIGTNTVSLATMLLRASKESKEERLRREAIAQKIAAITPTLTKLNANTKPYTKLKIIDEVDSNTNWNTNSNPPVREDSQFRYTGNASYLTNGALKISTENYVTKVFNSDKDTKFETTKSYKNTEKFDFSKDFTMSLYFKLDIKPHQSAVIEIGKGYNVKLQRQQGTFLVSTPINYTATDKYGVLQDDNNSLKSEVLVKDEKGRYSLTKGTFNRYCIGIREKKIPEINFDDILKLTITKKGNVFTCKLNDLPVEMTSVVSYFPNKYYLGFLLKNEVPMGGKKSFIEIHKLELQHL